MFSLISSRATLMLGSSGRVTVWLKNAGNDGYRKDKYGDTIIIERSFTVDGTSNYKLKSATGGKVSDKKEELSNITDHYGLQVDNPMTILTQDNAKSFLGSSTNAEKYKLFNRGVQLEQLDQDYSLIKTAINHTEVMLETKKESLQELSKMRDDAQEKMQRFDSHINLRRRHKELQHLMAWIQVRDAKLDVQKKEEEIAKIQQKIETVEERSREADEDYESADKARIAALAKIEQAKARQEPFQEEKNQCMEDFTKNRKELLGTTVFSLSL